MNLAELTAVRLENVLSRDKKQNPNQILGVLKSDLYSLLENYLELKKISVGVDVVDGEYVLRLSATARHIKSVGLKA